MISTPYEKPYQHQGTSATHYYLNPNIPEVNQILQTYKETPDKAPILTIRNQRYDDPEQEKTRNRFRSSVLMEVDAQNYQRAGFTSEATIYKINTVKPWYYQKCATCGKKLTDEKPTPSISFISLNLVFFSLTYTDILKVLQVSPAILERYL